jgi:hypothetical protein
MDDLVLTGAAGIIGLFLAGVVLLYGMFSVAGLIYAAFVSGEYGGILIIVCTILVAGSLYMAAGFWLHKTDRI